jgi:DNA-binding GntR family transcriptional regulator
VIVHDVPPRERELPSKRVEAGLRRRIDAAEWDHGQALPSVAALAQHYSTSRATVAKALRRIADDGLVEIVPQWGTFRT